MVRVVCRRARAAGAAALTTAGSGFLLGRAQAEKRFVLTAAHVVAERGNHAPMAIEVQLRMRTASDTQPWHHVAIWGASVVYPAQWARCDLAAIRLSQSVAALTHDMEAAEVAKGRPFDGLLYGYPNRNSFLRNNDMERPIRARPLTHWLQYLRGRGSDGMSGGPLCCDGYVVGVHTGTVYIEPVKKQQLAATPIGTTPNRQTIGTLMERADHVAFRARHRS